MYYGYYYSHGVVSPQAVGLPRSGCCRKHGVL